MKNFKILVFAQIFFFSYVIFNEATCASLHKFRLVGDNIDLMVHARIQSQQHENRSIHWTQQYAVLNRVQETSLDTKRPRKSLKEVQLIDLLPNQSVQGRLKQRWAVLVSRIVCRYLPAFQHQRDVVIWHIPHRYSKEMSSKSQTVSKIGQCHNHIYLLHSCGDIKLSTIFVESSIKTGFSY